MDAKSTRIGLESAWVLIMTLLGAGVRLKGFHKLGLDHFDEGIYAITGLWPLLEHGLLELDQTVIPYAPPGYPAIIGLAYLLLGMSDRTPILLSMMAGTLTIPAVAGLARRVFGPGAGAAAASLAAISGPLVLFSRTALTDTMFLLGWMIAIGASLRFLERPGLLRAIGLGAAVGLLQLIKYNGWMVGAIVVLTILMGLVRSVEERRAALKALGVGLLAVVVAAIVYAPWFAFVDRHFGYGNLLSHHRSYVDGPALWWSNWQQQMAQSSALAGRFTPWISWVGGALAMAWIGAVLGRRSRPDLRSRTGRLVFSIGVLILASSLFVPANLPWWIAMASAPWLLWNPKPGIRLIGVWWVLMSLTTPLYHPYARLWLPTLAASWVVTGGILVQLIDLGVARNPRSSTTEAPEHPTGRSVVIAAIAGVILAVLGPWLQPAPIRPFPTILVRSDGLRRTIDRLAEQFQEPDRPFGLEYFARRPVGFYFIQHQLYPFRMHPQFEVLVSIADPRSVILLDSAVGVDLSTIRNEPSLKARGAPTHIRVPVSIPTLLDVRPELVYDLDSDPGGLIRRLSTAEQEDPRYRDVAGWCDLWILPPQTDPARIAPTP